MALAILGLFAVYPVISATYAAPVYISEDDVIVPYLRATLDVWVPATIAKAMGFHPLVESGSYAKIPVDFTLGIIPSANPPGALTIMHVSSRFAPASTSDVEVKASGDKVVADGILDMLHPVATLAEMQINATWYTLSEPIQSNGKHYILYIASDKDFTVKYVKYDPDTNATNGNEVTLWNTTLKVNASQEFWLVLPYDTISRVYIEYSGSYIPIAKIYQNELAVQDSRYLKPLNVKSDNTPEVIDTDEETNNIFVGVDNLHSYVMQALEAYFGDVTAYNVTSFKIEARLGKNIKYASSSTYMAFSGQQFSIVSIKTALFLDLGKEFNKFSVTVAGSLDQVKTVLSQTAGDIQKQATSSLNVITASATDLAKKAMDAGSSVVTMATKVGEDVNGALAAAGKTVGDVASATGKTVGDVLSQAGKTVTDFGGSLLQGAQSAVGSVINFGGQAFGAITGFIKKGILMVVIAIIAVIGIIIVVVVLVMGSRGRGKGGL